MILPDQQLPGFVRCFDMETMRQALQDGLPSLGAVHACKLERFRYRKQSRASFLYKVESENGTNLISGSLYKGDKSRSTFEAAGTHTGTGYAPDLGMVFECFPHDRKLGLASALAAGDWHDVLHALAPLFDGAPLSITEVEIIRYRPRIAAVFRIAVSSSKMDQRFYVKTYADEDVSAIHDSLMRVKDGTHFSMLKPVAVIEQFKAIVWPEVRGFSLAQSLIADERSTAMRQGAHALAEFHRSQQELLSIPPRHYAHNDAVRHATFITSIMPGLASLAESLMRTIPDSFGEKPVGPFHHDMKPEHVLQEHDKTHFIDVEGIALGDPAFDVGNMLARISAGPWLFGSTAIQSQCAFKTFLENSLPVSQNKSAAAYALGKMKLATYAISHQINDWAAIAEAELVGAAATLRSRTVA